MKQTTFYLLNLNNVSVFIYWNMFKVVFTPEHRAVVSGRPIIQLVQFLWALFTLKRTLLLGVFLFYGISSSLLFAQKETPSGTIDDLNRSEAPAEIAINILSSEYSNGALKIVYEIPYDGIVDFKILNQEGLKKFHNQYNAKKGTNKIRIKPMNASMGNYTFQMYYKGFKVEKSFTYS